MEDQLTNSAAIPWDTPADTPAGLQRKLLRRGADGRPRVALLRLAAGFEAEAHRHELSESHYVLEGMYESQGREFPAGTYRFIPAHSDHGPFRTHAGALLLVFWE